MQRLNDQMKLEASGIPQAASARALCLTLLLLSRP
jgi:hypothetical protein